MAQSKAVQKSTYPLPAYNFRVTIDGTSMSFAEVSGINLEQETVTYRHGFSAWEGEELTKYHVDKFFSVTLKKGVMKNADFLKKWLEDRDNSRRTMEISLCDEKGEPVITWRAGKAVPVKLEAPGFDATTNDVAIDTLEVMAASISIEYH